MRDNRDSQLRRVLRKLLEEPTAPAAATSEEQRDLKPTLDAPTEVGVMASADEMQELSDEDIRARTTANIAWRPEPEPEPRDPRLPPPGSVLERRYGSKDHRVEVLVRGFRYRGRIYPTLTKAARAFTGRSENGFDFFGLSLPWSEAVAQIRGRRLNRSTMIDLPICKPELKPEPELEPELEPEPKLKPKPKPRDPRLPPPGSVLERWYGGKAHRVEVLEWGFRYWGQVYPSLGRIRRTIAGSTRDSFVFFGLSLPWSERVTQLRGRHLNRKTLIDLPSATEF